MSIKGQLNSLKQGDIAALLGKTERTIQLWHDKGLPRNGSGIGCRYVWKDVFEWYQGQISGSKGDETDRDRKIRLEADLLEMEVQEQRGELLPALEAREAWRGEVTRCRTKLLAIPNKIGPQLVGQPLPETVAILAREVNEALAELANG